MIDPKHLRPPQIAFSLVLLAVLLHFILKPQNFIATWGHYLGAGLFIIGLGMLSAARMQFKKYNTPVRHSERPVKLVTDGLFACSRNPMYVGGLILFSGLALWVGTWPFFLVPAVLFVVLDRIFIPWEEKLMADLFGDEYTEYLKQHRRWV